MNKIQIIGKMVIFRCSKGKSPNKWCSGHLKMPGVTLSPIPRSKCAFKSYLVQHMLVIPIESDLAA